MARQGRRGDCRILYRFIIAGLVALGCAALLVSTGHSRRTQHHARPQALTTPWTSAVGTTDVLPEYPRPQMTRAMWLNLNGYWDFMSTAGMPEQPPIAEPWAEQIVVPFPVQSALSRIERHAERMWYRRHFSMPRFPDGYRILLHFGAVDFESRVWLNGQLLGRHHGGYDAFSFDVTEALAANASAQHELLVFVFDPTTAANSGVPLGKQALTSRAKYSIFYTPVSGIWQTVWLEPVPPAHITRLDLTPDIDASLLRVVAHVSPAAAGMRVIATASDGPAVVGTAEGLAGAPFHLHLRATRLWSPADPYLYNLTVQLVGQPSPLLKAQAPLHHARVPAGTPVAGGGASELARPAQSRRVLQVNTAGRGPAPAPAAGLAPGAAAAATAWPELQQDAVTSYFGMRKVALARDGAGQLRIQLNNQVLFQLGLLDQGYWPDGLYTAACDAALRWDITAAKALGFNMLRKHMKIEPARWYHAADRAGMLVWQDMPAMCGGGYPSTDEWATGCFGGDHHVGPGDKPQFQAELERLVEQHISHPSIVAWVVFNEGWGQHDTVQLAELVMKMDPSRLVDAASGWDDFPVGMIKDQHDYTENCTAKPATATRAAVLGEFGGLGMRVAGHEFDHARSFSYRLMNTSAQLEAGYRAFAHQIKKQILDPEVALSGAVYTELADVEGEVNGLITYDRRVTKLSPEALTAINADLIAAGRSVS